MTVFSEFMQKRKDREQKAKDKIVKAKALIMSSQGHLDNAIRHLSKKGSTERVVGWRQTLADMISDAQHGNSWEPTGQPSIRGCRLCVRTAKQIGEPKEVVDELILAVRAIVELGVYYPEERARDNLFDCMAMLGEAQPLIFN